MKHIRSPFLFAIAAIISPLAAAQAFNPLQQPPESAAVPGNVMLALSVEFPTGLQVSYRSQDYSAIIAYDGYFDNRKCYTYSTANEVFTPSSAATAGRNCGSTTEWNGNFLNWLTMTNLDQFRSVMTGGTRDNFSSMSGAHPGDTTTRTVLIRSFSDRNAYNPIKRIRTNSPGVPQTLRSSDKFVRSGGYGSKFIVSDSSNFADWDINQQRARCSSSPLPGAAGTSSCFNIRVEVCRTVSGVGREANCQTQYSGIAKPEGLIQQYAGTLRFGAAGFLNDTGNTRQGGVIRSPIKSVGAIRHTATGVEPNPNREWDANTGVMFSNPDPSDATASSVSNSGLINYLNKFGYTSGYKGNDPVSELYYAALRYLRGHPLPAEYVSNLNDARKDGFPVITGSAHERGGSRDPIIQTCQKNFILGIGDIYTHCDGNLPGSTQGLNATCGTGTPGDPDGLNVQSLWNRVTTLEGTASWTGGASNGTPYMAGLAHWANTSDIRGDLDGEQNVSTYWVDVLENGNGVNGMPAAGTVRSQYWLAAKYGGFDRRLVTSGDNPNTTAASWDRDGDGVPNTWFPGDSPARLREGLSSAFADIASRAGDNSASSAAVSSGRQTSSSQIIYAGYNPRDWSGTVTSCRPEQTEGQCRTSPQWEASSWFLASNRPAYATVQLTHLNRKIFTAWRSDASFTSMPFQWSSLNSDQRSVLNLAGADSNGSARVDYLRGSRENEGTLFRTRHAALLGDIVNSGITYLQGSGPARNGVNFPNHAEYRASTRNRPGVVYVGGNDGMLHAFSAVNGRELFAYIPSAVFANLPGLARLDFQHRYFVDSTPMVGDIETSSGNWATYLVGGLGAGGRGYYALNITNQSNFAGMSEGAMASMARWEFTSVQDPDLGYTFNEPSLNPVTGAFLQIAKVADSSNQNGVWRVIVGNGYGSDTGVATLFMLNAVTGAASTKLQAHAGPFNGLSTPTPLDTDGDGLVDTVYAGDMQGNMHKFQFSRSTAGQWVVAPSGDASGSWRYIGRVYESGQPITTAPSVAPSCAGTGWDVMFGSGKLNEGGDYTDNSPRSFFSVRDEGNSSLTVPASDLVEIQYEATTLANGRIGRDWDTPDFSNRRGWRMNFTDGERVLSNSTLPPDTGVVLFATTQPSGDVCAPGNNGFVMAVNRCTGASGSLVVGTTETGGVAINSTGVLKLSPTYVDENGDPTVVCNQPECRGLENKTIVNKSVAPKGRYNWREILTK